MSQLRSQLRVFVVDDELIIASTLAIILERSGFEVLYFTEPLKALSAAQQSAPDLLLTDVVMPGLSGIDLAIAVRIESPRCKVLLFSGQAATVNLLQEAKAKGYDFELIGKPIHPKDLLVKIQYVTQGA